MHEYNPEDIVVTEVPIGRDMMLIVTGGTAHIGAVSTAYVGPSGEIEVQTSEVPGHKEHTISEDLALKAARVLNRTVTVAMGIHYDNISKEEIMDIIAIVNGKMDDFLRQGSKL
ncbi:prenylated flavin chaperone LpdD [Paenibacillus macquariensis]|uniref:Prenylated flavin chaperone LpdD-like domain-containing protein n=1 Tax=Paenibacillus macquariensis TaxID=948756 RepID=A0ABY1K7T1_9BACL|nr:hypothetical protein [Paenibacillus macquariensis]MEC0091156.1 hypothetical protein [Paenibacillus macquariensis]OAB33660.1 hypothetical protein PMSM_13620 [Paenibacillus macquariensis subsp. macquariensis]SIR38326.1 hypothetical protein SAMN05421578_112106 [Paenibacillus macquariensis]